MRYVPVRMVVIKARKLLNTHYDTVTSDKNILLYISGFLELALGSLAEVNGRFAIPRPLGYRGAP